MTCPDCKRAEQQPDSAYFMPDCTSCRARAFAVVGQDLPDGSPKDTVDLWKRWRRAVRQHEAAQKAQGVWK
jgi:hypothetical protein